MIRVLVSVRSVEEALAAAEGGADLIDLKDPAQGALGGLPVPTIDAIVAALRVQRSGLPISATIGDRPMHALDGIRAQVDAVGRCGVDYVKVGIEPEPGAAALLAWLAGCGWPVVPVFIADRGLDPGLLDQALALGFPGVMADTARKNAGTLFDILPAQALHTLVARAREAGVMVGLAGALGLAQAEALAALRPDFAGFRSAVCTQGRAGPLDGARLRALRIRIRQAEAEAEAGVDQATPQRASPSNIERTRASSAW